MLLQSHKSFCLLLQEPGERLYYCTQQTLVPHIPQPFAKGCELLFFSHSCFFGSSPLKMTMLILTSSKKKLFTNMGNDEEALSFLSKCLQLLYCSEMQIYVQHSGSLFDPLNYYWRIICVFSQYGCRRNGLISPSLNKFIQFSEPVVKLRKTQQVAIKSCNQPIT